MRKLQICKNIKTTDKDRFCCRFHFKSTQVFQLGEAGLSDLKFRSTFFSLMIFQLQQFTQILIVINLIVRHLSLKGLIVLTQIQDPLLPAIGTLMSANPLV